MHGGHRPSELWSCLALRHCDGLGPRTWKNLLDTFGSADAAIGRVSEWVDRGCTSRSLADNFLQEKWRPAALAEFARIRDHGFRVLLYADPEYPERLRQIPSPPLFLYLHGDPGLLSAPCLAMVGSRSCSRYGLQAAGDIAASLSRQGITIVSGFALGIDRQAHQQAMTGPGRSLAVLGTGIDMIYPASNSDLWRSMSQDGLILTEFGPGTRPEAHNFPRRNRIISGLSLGVLVVEAARRSGSLITARTAMEQNREVFALPGPINLPTYAGCNALLREGATLIRSAEDILEELAPLLRSEWPECSPPSQSPPPASGDGDPNRLLEQLAPDERQVAQFLLKNPQAHIDSLAQHLGWENSQVSRTLLLLEMQGVVKQLTGMYYSLAGRGM
jgi:DNA processing protein